MPQVQEFQTHALLKALGYLEHGVTIETCIDQVEALELNCLTEHFSYCLSTLFIYSELVYLDLLDALSLVVLDCLADLGQVSVAKTTS